MFAARFGIEPETRLLGALGRDFDFAFLADIGDGGVFERFLDGFANLRAGAPEEALPVGKAFALGIKPAIDEVGHRLVLRDAAPAAHLRMTIPDISTRFVMVRCERSGS